METGNSRIETGAWREGDRVHIRWFVSGEATVMKRCDWSAGEKYMVCLDDHGSMEVGPVPSDCMTELQCTTPWRGFEGEREAVLDGLDDPVLSAESVVELSMAKEHLTEDERQLVEAYRMVSGEIRALVDLLVKDKVKAILDRFPDVLNEILNELEGGLG